MSKLNGLYFLGSLCYYAIQQSRYNQLAPIAYDFVYDNDSTYGLICSINLKSPIIRSWE